MGNVPRLSTSLERMVTQRPAARPRHPAALLGKSVSSSANLRRVSNIGYCVAYALSAIHLTVAAASAQERSIIEQTWHHFLERCSLAYSDPQGYLNDIAATPTGYHASTLDGQFRWGTLNDAVSSEGYSDVVAGNRREQRCDVMGVLEGNLAASSAVNQAFLQDLAARPSVAVVGGPMPVAALGAGGTSGIEAGTYMYAVVGVLPFQIMAEVSISPWYVEISSTHHTEN